MKRYIHSSSSTENSNIKLVCDAMGYPYPTRRLRTKDGYSCRWGDRFGTYSLTDMKYHEILQSWLEDYFKDKQQARAYFDHYDLLSDIPGHLKTTDPHELLREFNSQHDWKDYQASAEADIDEIYRKTGIRCKLTSTGSLVIPFSQ